MPSSEKVAITNVRVFDGRRLSEPVTVVIDGPLIGTDPAGAHRIDAHGGVLLPGLIDSHLHLEGRDTLETLARYGVTTALDMAFTAPEKLPGLRGLPGLPDIRSAGLPVIGPNGPHARLPFTPERVILTSADQAEAFVAARVADGSDHIKIVLEAPGEGGPDQDAADALVRAAHAHGRQVVAHAASGGAYLVALDAGADVITHVPMTPPLSLDPELVKRVAADGRVVVPTLTMSEGALAAMGHPDALVASIRVVGLLHQAGVPILAGTDANAQPGTPYQPPFGESLHHELELLVEAGLSQAEALRAATELPARHFGLTDRGAVTPGLRADLVLVDGDPLADISATRAITRVWCGGQEAVPPRP
ncbi:amidohydrolase family protein [Microbispora sp. NPDC046933]|uniref:amidohydrolase family protein n=1 Tax=Microbispora sp. NPDC046933 TaxID=3155618 RepID=UPI0033E9FB6A